jgi:transcriptional antiterminator RfaH
MTELGKDKRWFAVHTGPQSEQYASEQLSAQGFRVFLPQYMRRRSHARRIERLPYPLFPRYLFVEIDMTLQRWRSVNGALGVSRIIGNEDGPTPVAEGVVEELMRRRDESGMIKLAAAPSLALGDKVRIRGGSFASMLGLVEGVSDRDRVSILVDLLGRKVRVTLDAPHLEKAA